MFRCSTSQAPGATDRHGAPPDGTARRRPGWATAALLSLAGCWAPGAQALDGAELVQLGGSIVKIEAVRQQGGYALGSGVVVAPGKVATNCHVTRDGSEVRVLRGGLRHTAEAQASDLRHDLCVLSVPQLGAPAVAVAPDDAQPLQPGQAVSAIGYTGGVALQRSGGEIVALHRLDGGQVIQSTNWFNSGASGGGLFDETQQLVGLLTFRMRGTQAHYYAAPVAWLRPLLRDDALRPVAPLARNDPPFWERPAGEQPRFLQAAVIEREHRWQDLDALATAWAREDRADAQPWLVRGLAQQQLGRLPAAQKSLEQALAIDPASRSALLQLGLLHAAQGHFDTAQALLLRLQSLRSELAGALDRAIVRP